LQTSKEVGFFGRRVGEELDVDRTEERKASGISLEKKATSVRCQTHGEEDLRREVFSSSEESKILSSSGSSSCTLADEIFPAGLDL